MAYRGGNLEKNSSKIPGRGILGASEGRHEGRVFGPNPVKIGPFWRKLETKKVPD